jgi:hypothetical protein
LLRKWLPAIFNRLFFLGQVDLGLKRGPKSEVDRAQEGAWHSCQLLRQKLALGRSNGGKPPRNGQINSKRGD